MTTYHKVEIPTLVEEMNALGFPILETFSNDEVNDIAVNRRYTDRNVLTNAMRKKRNDLRRVVEQTESRG